MKRCLVVGAGGCGREVFSWAASMQQCEWELTGFLDANAHALDDKDFPARVLGDPASWEPTEDEVFIAGLGNPRARIRICNELIVRGARFIGICHPTVVKAFGVVIGEGCVLSPHVVIGANAKLERFSFVNVAATIGHDCLIGEGVTLSSHCDVMGYAKVGRMSFLGGHSCVLANKTVGDNAIVGAGSVVVRNVAAHSTVMGIPAKVLISSPA